MKIDRLIGILSILLQEEKTTAPELAEKFEVSRRTINRDIEDLCKAGIPIRTAQGTGGGISIMDGYRMDRTILTSKDMQMILAGLDVVKSKIESLSGEVEVKSKLGEGSTWIIRLPLTLAIIQALMVIVGGEKYAISLGSIQTIEDINPAEIKLVGNNEVINLRGNVIPLVRLSKELDIESQKSPEENMVVVIVKKGEKLAGLVVDELIGQQEIVIKSLGKYINKCKIISGATILGDGEVALILDANALI